MTRKTIPVQSIIDFANTALATIVDEPITEGVNRRWGVIGMVESALHATENYKGFNYLATEFATPTEPGVFAGLRPGYDETRRTYFS